MVLRYVITAVGASRPRVIVKLYMRFLAAEPVEKYVHGFGFLRGDNIVDDSEGRGVVCLHWHWRLSMSHGDEGMSGGYRFAEIDLEGSKFILCL